MTLALPMATPLPPVVFSGDASKTSHDRESTTQIFLHSSQPQPLHSDETPGYWTLETAETSDGDAPVQTLLDHPLVIDPIDPAAMASVSHRLPDSPHVQIVESLATGASLASLTIPGRDAATVDLRIDAWTGGSTVARSSGVAQLVTSRMPSLSASSAPEGNLESSDIANRPQPWAGMPELPLGAVMHLVAHPGSNGNMPDLVVGIARASTAIDPAAGGPDATSASASKITNAFLVTVDRQDRNPGATGGDNPRQGGDFGSLSTGAWIVAPKLADAQSADASIDSADETSSAGEVRLGQGPAERIPLLAAGPSAGMPGEPERIEPVDPLEGALVDLTLVDLSPEVDPAALTPSDAAALMAEAGSVSGFPGLLGTELAPLVPSNNAGIAATQPNAGNAPAVSAQNEEAPLAEPIESTPDRRATVGIGVLAGATVALLLPDLAARLRAREVRRPKTRGTRFSRFWAWRLRFLRP